MDPAYTEAIRILAAVVGAAILLAYRDVPTWRHAAVIVMPGAAAGVFLEPLLCDIAAASAAEKVHWLVCEQPHVQWGLSLVVGLLGHSGCRSLIAAGDSWGSETIRAWIMRLVGGKVSSDKSVGRPDSDPGKV